MSNGAFEQENMKDLREAVEFPVSVNGRKMMAKIIAFGDDGKDVVYKVLFSDGYSDHFHMNDEILRGELPESRKYAAAIVQDISIMAFYQPDKILTNFRHVVKREVNVWVQETNEEDEPPTFAVHYFGRCQFWLHKIGEKWELILPAVNENGEDDEDLVKRIGHLLDILL